MKFHFKKVLTLSLVIVAVGILAFTFAPRFASAEAGPGGGGGSSGCSRGSYSTCYGAVWRYYKTNANSYTIPNVGGGATKITGCSAFGGFFAYVLVNKNDPNNANLVRSWKIGPNGGIAGDRSIFFGGWTNYRIASNASDPIPINPGSGQYSWYSVKKAFAQTQSLGQNGGYTWDGNSSLGWFCYQGLDFNLVPTITGTPTYSDGDSTGADKATLSPSVKNTGGSSSSSAQWRVVTFQVPPNGSVPSAAINGTSPEQYYGNGAVAIASGTGVTFPRNVTPINVAQQAIGDYPIGTKLCYALSVNPVTQSNGSWSHSTPFCIVIAKSPKIQVHGGDIRVGSNFVDQTVGSGSNIITSQTVKNR